MLNIALVLVVENAGNVIASILQSLECLLVRGALVLVRVLVHNNALVARQEFLLEGLCINHGWSQVQVFRIKTELVRVTVTRANLVVDTCEIALGTATPYVSRQSWIALGIDAPSFGLGDKDLVESGRSGLQFDVLRVIVLTGGDICDHALHNSVHLSNSGKDALSELFLVVNCEPAAEHLRNVGLQHLRDAQLAESFLVQYFMVFELSWLSAELLRILGCVSHATENVFGICHLLHV